MQNYIFTIKTIISLILLHSFVIAQTQDGSRFQQQYQLKIKKSSEIIKIDGEFNEATWKYADVAKDFWMKWPNDNEKAKRPTEVRASYDEKYLYFAAVCYDTNSYVIQTLKRDSRYFESDGFAVILDPVNKKSNGFFFGVTPQNVQTEDLLTANQFGNLTFSWDNKWLSATKRHEKFWTVEMAIPYKTLRFDATNTIWGINFIRNDLKNYHYHTWTNVPIQFNGFDFGYTGALIWDTPPAKQGKNISLIPFTTGGISENKEDGISTKSRLTGGLDAKIALSSTMNMDITLNPDFSQIEVDQQVTNLTRFNIYLPERRTFFLENDDIFSSYGAPPFRPFYTRSIGLDKNGNTIPILGGVRISGNATNKLRIGVMNMQTGVVDAETAKRKNTSESPAQNFSALTFSQRFGSRSSIKGYFLNRQQTSVFNEKTQSALDKYGRNAGVEVNYSNTKGDINFWGGYHLSTKPTIEKQTSFYQIGGGYFGRNFSIFADFDNFGQNYYTDMGYVNRIESFATKGASYDDGDTTIRMGFKMFYAEVEYNIRPKNGKINQHRFGIENYDVFQPANQLNERFNRLRYFIMFKNTAMLAFRFDPQMTKLLYYTPLPNNKPIEPGNYYYSQYNISYDSDARKKLAFNASTRFGGLYNGTLQQYILGITLRKQPWGNFSVKFENDRIKFPVSYGDVNLFLISPRIEINFSNSLFWTTFLQYNTQRNNFNINSRLQWRYKPMSDFFLVYTDNYFTDPLLKNKNRALVFKLNYWLTI